MAGTAVTPLKFIVLLMVVGAGVWAVMRYHPTTQVVSFQQSDVQIPLVGFRDPPTSATSFPTDYVAGGQKRVVVVHEHASGRHLFIRLHVDKKHLPIENGEVALASSMVELQGGPQPLHPLFLIRPFESAERGLTLCHDVEDDKSAELVQTLVPDRVWSHPGKFDGDMKFGRNGFEGNKVFRGSRGMQITAQGKIATIPGESEPTNVLWMNWDPGSRGWLAETEFRMPKSLVGWTMEVNCLFQLPPNQENLTLLVNGHKVPVSINQTSPTKGA